MTGMLLDLRYALRSLRERPGFSLLVIVTMGFGVGATVAGFSYLSFFLRPTVDAPEPERVMWLHIATPQNPTGSLSYPDWLDLADQQEVFSQLVAYRIYGISVIDGERSLFAWGHAVSGEYFALFDARATLGRLLGPHDDRPDAPRVVVLNRFFWERRFGADPGVIGRTILLAEGTPYTIVGVTRPGFQGSGIATEIYVPLASADAMVPDLQIRDSRRTLAQARLRPGISREQALGALAAVAAGLDQAHPEPQPRQLTLRSFAETADAWQGDPALEMAKIFMAAVLLLLLLACANVANLLLARAAARGREMGIHAALGCGRARLARRLLVESLLLAGAGGLLGLGLAQLAPGVLESYLRQTVPITMGSCGPTPTRSVSCCSSSREARRTAARRTR